MTADIRYIATDQQGLDLVGELWEKLNEHHRARSGDLSELYRSHTWLQRKERLLKKATTGRLRVDIVRDAGADRYVGYVVTSLSAERRGEIESIYVEPEYRGQGVGDCLMRRALAWLDDSGATVKVLGVAAGNEEVFGFYRRFGFVPQATILRQAADPQA